MPSSVLCVQSFLLCIVIDPKLEVFYGSSTTKAVKPIKSEARNLNTKNTPAIRQGSLCKTHLLLPPQSNIVLTKSFGFLFTICTG